MAQHDTVAIVLDTLRASLDSESNAGRLDLS